MALIRNVLWDDFDLLTPDLFWLGSTLKVPFLLVIRSVELVAHLDHDFVLVSCWACTLLSEQFVEIVGWFWWVHILQAVFLRSVRYWCLNWNSLVLIHSLRLAESARHLLVDWLLRLLLDLWLLGYLFRCWFEYIIGCLGATLLFYIPLTQIWLNFVIQIFFAGLKVPQFIRNCGSGWLDLAFEGWIQTLTFTEEDWLLLLLNGFILWIVHLMSWHHHERIITEEPMRPYLGRNWQILLLVRWETEDIGRRRHQWISAT